MKFALWWATAIYALLVLCGCEKSPMTKRFEFREDKSGRLIRLDTITGEATIADDEGSHQLLPPKDTSTPKIVANAELSKLTGNAGCFDNPQRFAAHNGTSVVLRTLGITITNKKALSDEIVWRRQFIARDLYIRPQEVKTIVLPLTGVEGSYCD